MNAPTHLGSPGPPLPRFAPDIQAELGRIEHLLVSIESNFDQASRLAELGAMTPLFAHEINNLMTQVGGRAQLALAHPEKPEAVQRALELAARSAEHIARLAEFFLEGSRDVSKARAHQDVRAAHESALGFVPPEDREAFGFDLHESAPRLGVQILPVLLEQVLLNLYLNAARALRQRGDETHAARRVRINAERAGMFVGQQRKPALAAHADCSMWNNAELIRITVADTGVGMEPDQVADLFANDRSPVSHGHGIGLTVCRRMLTQSGGSIECESAPGQGTRMIITLPAADHCAQNGGGASTRKQRPAA